MMFLSLSSRPATIARLALVATVLWTGAASVRAATFEEGSEAYRKGDYTQALDIWQALANEGNSNAQYAAGYMHQSGIGTEANTTRAALLYDEAARQGDRDAQYALGMLLQFGDGVPQNFPLAMEWFKKATEGEPPHADAEFAIARLYFRGLGEIPQDMTQAVQWLQLSATHGHPAAHYLLASCYETGQGVEEDKILAYFHYSKAAQSGAAVLQSYDSSYRAEEALKHLKSRMKKAEIAEGDSLLTPKTTPATRKK